MNFEDELIYDTPIIRLKGDTLQFVQGEIDRYAFRINETSRFMMALGGNTFTHNGQLRLTELREGGVSWIGKQEFSQNVIDTVVGPGDYSLIIE
jgi:hypothetical protein